MPDPWAWSVALAASFTAGAFATWSARRVLARRGPATHGVVLLASFAAAALLGWALLGIAPRLSPRNALDRFLLLLFPGALALETLGAANWMTPRAAWWLRAVLAPLVGVTLLYDSVYLRPGSAEWATGVGALGVTGGGFALWLAGHALTRGRSEERPSDTSDPATSAAIGLAILTAGFATMLAGYLKGGAAALPLAGAMAAATCTSYARRDAPDEPHVGAGVARLGVVSLYGLVIIGRFFGGLTTFDAALLFLAPLGALAPGWFSSRVPRDWRGFLFGLFVASVPLAVVVVRAIGTFQQKFQPLVK